MTAVPMRRAGLYGKRFGADWWQKDVNDLLERI